MIKQFASAEGTGHSMRGEPIISTGHYTKVQAQLCNTAGWRQRYTPLTPDLMSRCTTPLVWRKLRPRTTSRATSLPRRCHSRSAPAEPDSPARRSPPCAGPGSAVAWQQVDSARWFFSMANKRGPNSSPRGLQVSVHNTCLWCMPSRTVHRLIGCCRQYVIPGALLGGAKL